MALDLCVDPDEEDISVASAASPNEAEAEETEDVTSRKTLIGEKIAVARHLHGI